MRHLLIAIVVAVATVACSDDTPGRVAGEPGVTSAGTLSVFDLQVGDCLADPGEEGVPVEVESLGVVPCSEPHRLEVFALVQVETDDGLYPGEGEVTSQADARCLGQFAEYTGVEYFTQSELHFTYLFPTLDSWTGPEEDRTVVCVVASAPTLVASLFGSDGVLPLADDDQ